ncbi:MAG: urease accessory protein UreF [Betaproteobacteria bacterium]|nr:urease accessory protein UreF [Betaproteobacteria bacterium]
MASIATDTDIALARLLRLASPALPVGAYSYSQALEWAVESGTVRDAATAGDWIADALAVSIVRCEAPVWLRLYAACEAGDAEALARWNEFFLAARETAEFRAETLQMGRSLAALLERSGELPETPRALLASLEVPAFPAAFACAASAWRIAPRAGLTGYLFSWAENQAIAAVKLVPLGQSAAQEILARITAALPQALDQAFALKDDDIGSLAFGLAIASCRHETQYARLFRS